MKEKVIIFDSSTLISLSMNGLFDEFIGLKKIFNGYFIMTKEVKEETIEKPLTIKKFSLEALRMQELLDEGILQPPSCLGINDKEVTILTNKILYQANNLFSSQKRNIEIIGKGEASCMALSKLLSDKKIKNVIAIDERTTRVLGESPQNLISLLENKFHTKLRMNKINLEPIKGLKFIRSSELIYIAYKKGLIHLKGNRVLDALLYALKFKGCAISDEEIDEIKGLK